MGEIVSLACRWPLCPLQGTRQLLNTQNETEGSEQRGTLPALLAARWQWHDPNLFLLEEAKKGPWLFDRQLLKAGEEPQ